MIKYILIILVLTITSCSNNKPTTQPTPVIRDLTVTSISLPNGGPYQFLIADRTSTIEITVRNNSDKIISGGWNLGYDDFALVIDQPIPANETHVYSVQFTPLAENVPDGYIIIAQADVGSNNNIFGRRFGFVSGPIPIPVSNN